MKIIKVCMDLFYSKEENGPDCDFWADVRIPSEAVKNVVVMETLEDELLIGSAFDGSKPFREAIKVNNYIKQAFPGYSLADLSGETRLRLGATLRQGQRIRLGPVWYVVTDIISSVEPAHETV